MHGQYLVYNVHSQEDGISRKPSPNVKWDQPLYHVPSWGASHQLIHGDKAGLYLVVWLCLFEVVEDLQSVDFLRISYGRLRNFVFINCAILRILNLNGVFIGNRVRFICDPGGCLLSAILCFFSFFKALLFLLDINFWALILELKIVLPLKLPCFLEA